mmetsp:Transcript_24442/g.48692  ORF Transcript_24442/g.48692 Transcript_24442/m.48692 type:complete len:83 (-) Transcript_24442:115-363(-)
MSSSFEENKAKVIREDSFDSSSFEENNAKVIREDNFDILFIFLREARGRNHSIDFLLVLDLLDISLGLNAQRDLESLRVRFA